MAQKIYLAVVGGIFLASALYAYLDPHGLGQVMGIAPLDPSGVTEIRATYGGLVAGIGLLLISGLWSKRLAFAGLACTVFGVGALMLTRLLAEVLAGPESHGPGLAIVLKLLVVALAGLLRRAIRSGAARE